MRLGGSTHMLSLTVGLTASSTDHDLNLTVLRTLGHYQFILRLGSL